MSNPLISVLQKAPIFEELNRFELEELTPLFSQLSVDKGTIIFNQGDVGEEFYIVMSGHIKIYQNEEGKEIIFEIFNKGDYFGEMSVLDKDQLRSATAEAMDDCELFVLKRRNLLELLERKPKLMLKFLEVMMARLRRANELVKDLTTLDAKSRIIKTLVRLAIEHGIEHKKGTLIDLKITHQQLADMTSTVRETVTKTLLELQNQNALHIESRKLIIRNLDGLPERLYK